MKRRKKSRQNFRTRRILSVICSSVFLTIFVVSSGDFWQNSNNPEVSKTSQDAIIKLESLPVKGRAPKTGYSRKQFGDGWAKDASGCDMRNRILKRDLREVTENSKCQILTGILNDPYTGEEIHFSRSKNAAKVQIDHVVSLSDAWQKGAQSLTFKQRVELANDPLNLLASKSSANQQKGDSDAASWLPSNKAFRCRYVSRQISVKKKYNLWVTQSEKDAMKKVLVSC